jgi:copper transport protein
MRRAAAVALVAVAAGVAAGNAAAHPRATQTTPAQGTLLARPPAVVTVGLSEPATPFGAGISVVGPDGREAARGTAVVRGSTLSRPVDARLSGSYVVTWTVVGDDAHPARGVFVFSVRTRTAASAGSSGHLGTVLQTLGRLLSTAGFALGFGVPFAALLSGGMTRRLWRLVGTGIVLMLVAEPVALAGQTATLAPSRAFDPGLAADVLQTQYGHVAGLRAGAALVLWALVGAVRSGSARAQWAIPAAGGVAALVQADGGHRLRDAPTGVSLLLEGAHVASFAAWLGCVVVAVVASRGSALARPAVLSALVLVTTGAGLAMGQLEGASDLFHSAYGTTLAAKLVVVAAVFGIGALAWRRAELAGALVVLTLAALLVSLTPP